MDRVTVGPALPGRGNRQWHAISSFEHRLEYLHTSAYLSALARGAHSDDRFGKEGEEGDSRMAAWTLPTHFG